MLHGAAILARVRGFLITSALVLAIIGIGVGIESGSHPAGLFGTGQSAFIAAFPEQPSLATYESPNLGFGYFEPGVFSEVQLWGSDSSSSVLVGSFRGTPAQALADLVKTAKLHHSPVPVNGGVASVSINHGTASTRLIWRVNDPGVVPPWEIAIVEVRGVEVFYAVGSGDSYASANLTPSSFRLPLG